MTKYRINYPYLPKDEVIRYVPASNEFMMSAKKYAKEHSLDNSMPTASVVVINNQIIGQASNGSKYHSVYGCERVKRGIPTGENYELCEGCHPKNHSEPKAILDAVKNNPQAKLADGELYLWGHWWACEPCWRSIKKAGIKKVFLEENSYKLYNKNHPHNIVGKQFA